MTTIPAHLEGTERLKWIKSNKSILIAEKKMQYKQADPVMWKAMPMPLHDTSKAAADAGTTLHNSTVINSCYYFDSHNDVHIPGLWDKSLSELKQAYLLQEHSMTFDKIISDNVTAYVRDVSWDKLGVNAEGVTQCLVFDNQIEPDRNPFMYDQYKKGRVRNHSVGMRYVKIALAVKSDDDYFKEEMALWSKYYDRIANKEDVDAEGYFWAVTEAKIIEGSAVPIGSNIATPVLNTDTRDEPLIGTHDEPQVSQGKGFFSPFLN